MTRTKLQSQKDGNGANVFNLLQRPLAQKRKNSNCLCDYANAQTMECIYKMPHCIESVA